MVDLLQLTASIGGVGAVFGIVIFLIYRNDRKATEKMWRESKKFTEDRLTDLIEKDQSSREANTKALTELNTLLTRINGRAKYTTKLKRGAYFLKCSSHFFVGAN